MALKPWIVYYILLSLSGEKTVWSNLNHELRFKDGIGMEFSDWMIYQKHSEEESSFPRRRASLSQKEWEWDIACVHAKLLPSCLTLCDHMDHSPPCFSLHGILQARILECVAMPFSRGSSWPRDQIQVSYSNLHWQVSSLPLALPGKPGNGTLYKYK